MKILVRNQRNEKWQMVQSAAYANETELQKLLAEQPSLISVDEAREGAGTLVAAVREFPLEIGSIDLVGFTANGDIAVIECKLANNAEIKRKVIGQVFEYGASLWGMSYDDLDQKIHQRANQSLADLVRTCAGDPDWEEESFRVNVEHALQAGNFILIIVVDEINEDLSRIVRFINDAGRPTFSLAALEMRRFHRDQTEILVPHLFGTVAKVERQPASPRSRWTKERFFEVARATLAPEVVAVLEDLYNWSVVKAKRVWFGNGVVNGSFTFHYMENGKSVSMFSAYTNGVLSINYGYISMQVDNATVQRFHQSLTAIAGFEHLPADLGKFPSLRVEDVFLNKPNALAAFQAVIEDFARQLPKPSEK